MTENKNEGPLLSVRQALVISTSIEAAILVGYLTYISTSDPAAAATAAGSALLAAALALHKVIGSE